MNNSLFAYPHHPANHGWFERYLSAEPNVQTTATHHRVGGRETRNWPTISTKLNNTSHVNILSPSICIHISQPPWPAERIATTQARRPIAIVLPKRAADSHCYVNLPHIGPVVSLCLKPIAYMHQSARSIGKEEAVTPRYGKNTDCPKPCWFMVGSLRSCPTSIFLKMSSTMCMAKPCP